VCACVCVCLREYSCSTFKLFDEKNSSLPRAEYESVRTDAEENNTTSCFVRKVFASVSA